MISLHHLGLSLTGSSQIVDLLVDTVSTLGNEGLVVIAAEEDVTGESVLVGSLTVRVDGEDGVGVGDGDHDGSLGGLDLLGDNGVDGLGLVQDDDGVGGGGRVQA